MHDYSGRALPIHKALFVGGNCRAKPHWAVDLASDSVYVAARNLGFGFILLTRCQFWAATQVISQKLGVLPPTR
jgi:hypothetical protein